MREMLLMQGISYTYPDGTQALDGVSLVIGQGERLAILGSNGSGKSTLFLCLSGILHPQQGKIVLNGQPYVYCKTGLKDIHSNVGIVFQEADTQLFCIDVYQEIAFGPYNQGLRGDALDQAVCEQLEALDLASVQDRPPHYLSGGQKKRLSIATVLAMHPRVILFDEPTAALDPLHARQMMELLEKLHAQGVTIIMSTHDVGLAYAWADRVAVLGGGRVQACGAPEQVLAGSVLLRANGLEKPPVLGLFETLLEAGLLPQGLSPPRTHAALEQMIKRQGAVHNGV